MEKIKNKIKKLRKTIFLMIIGLCLIIILPLISASVYTNCVDNPGANIYTGNSLSFYDTSWERHMNFSSSCVDVNTISYGYCALRETENVFEFNLISCDCFEGKCIAKVSEVFSLLRLYGGYAGVFNLFKDEQDYFWYDSFFDARNSIFVDENLVSKAISDWINN